MRTGRIVTSLWAKGHIVVAIGTCCWNGAKILPAHCVRCVMNHVRIGGGCILWVWLKWMTSDLFISRVGRWVGPRNFPCDPVINR